MQTETLDKEGKPLEEEIREEENISTEEDPGTSADEEIKQEDAGKAPETEEAEAENKNAEPEKAEAETAGDNEGEAHPQQEDSPTEAADAAEEKNEKRGFFGRGRKKDKKDQQIEELKDRVMRQMAEFDNYRKRTDKEKSAMFEVGARSVIEKILPVVDNFERGLAAGEEAAADDPYLQGMQKIYRQLMGVLESLDVKAIDAKGKEFDPAFHNAVMHVDDDSLGENVVAEELQKGYMYRDTVIRHSMVKVAN